jgi:hypothetical protein
LAEIATLAERAAETTQKVQLVPGLDAVGDDLVAERAAETQDRANDRLALPVAADLADEGAVDLEAVDLDPLELGERRKRCRSGRG